MFRFFYYLPLALCLAVLFCLPCHSQDNHMKGNEYSVNALYWKEQGLRRLNQEDYYAAALNFKKSAGIMKNDVGRNDEEYCKVLFLISICYNWIKY